MSERERERDTHTKRSMNEESERMHNECLGKSIDYSSRMYIHDCENITLQELRLCNEC